MSGTLFNTPIRRPISDFFCHSHACDYFGIRDADNLVFRGYSGQSKNIRMVYCLSCRKSYSERRGTVLFNTKMSHEKAVSVLEHLREGVGVRATARLVRVNKNTVYTLARRAGEHAVRMHDELAKTSPQSREIQFDEKWSFVDKKDKNLTDDEKLEAAKGSSWDHVAEDAENRFVLSVVPGKRSPESCCKLIEDVKNRTEGRTDLLLTSDEYRGYKVAIDKAYGTKLRRRRGPARQHVDQLSLWPRLPVSAPAKIKHPENLVYATVRKTRRKGRVTKVNRTLVVGSVMILASLLLRSLVSNTINTSFVERINATDRLQNSRKRRKSYTHSRSMVFHDAMSYFVMYSYNFCWPVRTLQVPNEHGGYDERTPAMSAGLTDHVWSVGEWTTRPVRPG